MIKKYKNANVMLIVVVFLFYLFFTFCDGPIICDDSDTYINMSMMAEPIYPILLNGFKFIFGCNYLMYVVVLQGLLMAWSVCSIALYLKKEFNLNDYLTYLISFVFLSISLLCRFVANRSSMYSNSIITEGIAIPLFLLFFRFLLDYLLNSNNKCLVICLIISIVALSTRKQMYLTLFLLLIVCLYIEIKNKKYFRALLKVSLILFIALFSNRLIENAYFMKTREIENQAHTGDSRFLAAMAIYSCEEKDIELIDENNRDLFVEIYNECNDNSYLKKSSYGDWYSRFSHYSNNFDHVQLDVMWKKIREHAKIDLKLSESDLEIYADKTCSSYFKSLIPSVWPKVLSTIVDNYLAGLIIAVSAEREIFIYYSVFIYVVYILLLIYVVKKDGLNKNVLFSLVVLLSILMNDGIISIGVFNQTRYTIYNMGLFYCSLFLLGIKALSIKKSVSINK